MDGSIKLFQKLKIVLQHMGILSFGENREQNVFWRRKYFMLSIVLYTSASVSYFVFEAETVGEYTDAFYMYSTEMTAFFFYTTYLRKLPEILALSEKCDSFFQKSKQKVFMIVSNIFSFT